MSENSLQRRRLLVTRKYSWQIACAAIALASFVTQYDACSAADSGELRVMTWNIWNGGDGARNETDPTVKAKKQQRIVEVIRESGADVVAMVETYGSGETIAKGLGFHFHPRGTNVSVLSRWPFVKDLSVYRPFNCVGAVVERPDGQRLAVYSVWIHYVDDIWTDPRSRDGRTAADLLRRDGESRAKEIAAILRSVEEMTESEGRVPVILAGDFNSNSHLDYVDAAREQFGLVAEWPVTKAVADAGWKDAYRQCNPTIYRSRDRTWSPRFPEQIQDRIDFVFWKGATLVPRQARVIDRHGEVWPSDHAAVLAVFGWN